MQFVTAIFFLLVIGWIGVGDVIAVTWCELLHHVLHNPFVVAKKSQSQSEKMHSVNEP